MRKKITLSFQPWELESCDKRAKECGLTRTAYVKCLIAKDINKAFDTKNSKKRRISDYMQDKGQKTKIQVNEEEKNHQNENQDTLENPNIDT